MPGRDRITDMLRVSRCGLGLRCGSMPVTEKQHSSKPRNKVNARAGTAKRARRSSMVEGREPSRRDHRGPVSLAHTCSTTSKVGRLNLARRQAQNE